MARRFDVLLVESLDRLSRNLVEQETVIRRLEHRGIRIIGVSDGYDSASGTGRKLLRGVRGLISETTSMTCAPRRIAAWLAKSSAATMPAVFHSATDQLWPASTRAPSRSAIVSKSTKAKPRSCARSSRATPRVSHANALPPISMRVPYAVRAVEPGASRPCTARLPRAPACSTTNSTSGGTSGIAPCGSRIRIPASASALSARKAIGDQSPGPSCASSTTSCGRRCVIAWPRHGGRAAGEVGAACRRPCSAASCVAGIAVAPWSRSTRAHTDARHTRTAGQRYAGASRQAAAMSITSSSDTFAVFSPQLMCSPGSRRKRYATRPSSRKPTTRSTPTARASGACDARSSG